MPYFESIIGAIEKIPDVSVNRDYRNIPYIKEDSKIVLAVYCMMHNRMEVFYKLTESILEKQVVESYEGKKFYHRICIYNFYTRKRKIFKR